jgi:hypothetical protein
MMMYLTGGRRLSRQGARRFSWRDVMSTGRLNARPRPHLGALRLK